MRSLTCSMLLLWAAGSGVLSVAPVERIPAKRGQEFTAKITADLRQGFHANSNAPAEDFLIPMRLAWSGPLQTIQVTYPKPQFEKYAFSAKPVSVFSGTFDILTRFKVPANAPPGILAVAGKLRYQACNNKECLPPRTVDVQLPVNVQ